MIAKRLILLIFISLTSILAYSQPKSLNYEDEPKTYDFFMDVIYNPDLNLYNFLVLGLNSHNTELKDLNIYLKASNVRERCQELNIDITESYHKIKAAWKVFQEIENTDLNSFGQYVMDYHPNNMYLRQIQQNCPNKKLQHQLRIVPLKLEKY